MLPQKYEGYMKNIIVFISALMLISNTLKNKFDLSSPEKTLDTYISALKEGNKQKVINCFLNITEFNLSQPIAIESYTVIEKIVFHKKHVDELIKKGFPPSKYQIGDVKITLLEIINGIKEKYTYFLRKDNGIWKIIDHYSWNQPI
jgi:hypothetical protein